MDEQVLFKKQGTGTLQRKSSLLHSDDVFILIESCQSFPNINLMNPIFERKKRTKSTNQKAKKSGKRLSHISHPIYPKLARILYKTDRIFQKTAQNSKFQKHQSRPHIPIKMMMKPALPLYLT